MINELILPSKIHNTEQDVERDLRNWEQEDAKMEFLLRTRGKE